MCRQLVERTYNQVLEVNGKDIDAILRQTCQDWAQIAADTWTAPKRKLLGDTPRPLDVVSPHH